MDLYELDDTKQLQICDAVVISSFKKLDYVPRLDRECTTLLHKVSKAEMLRLPSRVGFPSVAIPCCMDVISRGTNAYFSNISYRRSDVVTITR